MNPGLVASYDIRPGNGSVLYSDKKPNPGGHMELNDRRRRHLNAFVVRA